MIPLNTSIGNRELSAWRPVPGVVWVQARVSDYAAKLAARGDSRPVMQGVFGGYLRTFEFEGKSMAWAHRLIQRYTRDKTTSRASTNEPLIGPNGSPCSQNPEFDHAHANRNSGSFTAEIRQEAVLA